jgi:hypothetical protein
MTMSTEEILTSIDKRLARIEAALTSRGGGASGAVADDADLDSQYGNPVIRKDPTKWQGPSYVGRTYSECSPEYLDSLAGLLDWKAGKNAQDPDEKKQKYAAYDRRDAARARGWAARIRAGGGSAAPREATRAAIAATDLDAIFGGPDDGLNF